MLGLNDERQSYQKPLNMLFMEWPWILIGVLAISIAYWCCSSGSNESLTSKHAQSNTASENPKVFRFNPAYDFDWTTTEPLQFRPFKPKYHLTMAIENLDPNDLVLFDKAYKSRLDIRHTLLKEHPDKVIGLTDDNKPCIAAAIKELYRTIMKDYLPHRYPTMFRAVKSPNSRTGSIHNFVTGQVWPEELAESMSARHALEILPRNVDEDFFILLPHSSQSGKTNSTDDEHTTYVLEAYSACFPSGFEPERKLGKSLSSIHEPLPGYEERLGRSMDRFFAKLPVGKYVKRVNWSITVDEELYSNYDKSGHAMSKKVTQMKGEDLDLNKSFLRCERQTLHRLPQSKAIVFAFHTYLYPLRQIKAEGLGESLAEAIEGLKLGNAPEIYTYKNAPQWGDAVKQYMRS